jgi:hypothetical protein
MNETHSTGEKPKRVWSPRALVWFAFLFSVFPAGIMFAVNYGRYGQPRKRLIWLTTTVILLLVFLFLDYCDASGTKLRFIGLTVLTAWILYAKQISLFRDCALQSGHRLLRDRTAGRCSG